MGENPVSRGLGRVEQGRHAVERVLVVPVQGEADHEGLTRTGNCTSVTGYTRGNSATMHVAIGQSISLLHATRGEEVASYHLGMVVDAGVNAHSLDATNHLCNLALVDGAEARSGRVDDLAGRRGEVLDERKVLPTSSASRTSKGATIGYLVQVERTDAQGVDDVAVSPRPLAPFGHFDGAKVMGGVYVAGLEAAGHLAKIVLRVLVLVQELQLRLLVAAGNLGAPLVSVDEAAGGVSGLLATL